MKLEVCDKNMENFVVVLLVVFACTAFSQPLENSEMDADSQSQAHHINKRFINPLFSLGRSGGDGLVKRRTKRSVYDECEKLELCKLHARSGHSFFAAFQLYFVNKENARLWDHRGRTIADCERRFGDCYNK